MDSILLRIANATQRQHDLILEMRGLHTELGHAIEAIALTSDEIQRRFALRSNLDPQEQARQQKDPPYYDPQANAPQTALSMGNIVSMPTSDDFSIPVALRSGPIKRGDA